MRFSAAFATLLPLQKLVASRLPIRMGAGHRSPAQPEALAEAALVPVTLPPASGVRRPEPIPQDLDQRVRELGEW